ELVSFNRAAERAVEILDLDRLVLRSKTASCEGLIEITALPEITAAASTAKEIDVKLVAAVFGHEVGKHPAAGRFSSHVAGLICGFLDRSVVDVLLDLAVSVSRVDQHAVKHVYGVDRS